MRGEGKERLTKMIKNANIYNRKLVLRKRRRKEKTYQNDQKCKYQRRREPLAKKER